MTPDPARHLDAIAAALASRGIPVQVRRLEGTPILTAATDTARSGAATVTIHADPWAAPALTLSCTCIWDPAPGAAPEAVAATAADILAAAGHPARPAAPAGAARLAAFLRRHPGWSAFWDKQYGVWRAAEDDPCSAWYTETPEPAAVISYITAHT
jgi:hypothetical protein